MSTKDWLEKDYYAALGVAKDADAPDDQEGRTASWPASCTRTRTPATPRPRRGSRRSPRPTTCSRTRPSARSTTRRARCSPAAASRRRLPGGGFGAGGSPRRWRRSTCPTCSAAPARRVGDGGLGDLFGGLFGGGGGAAPAAAAARRPARGQDVEAELTLDFDEAVRGGDAAAAAVRPGHLPAPATAAAPARARRRARCPTCGGSGFVSRNQGAFGFSEPCRDCRGTGQLIDDPCPDCAGSGVTTQTRTITVRVPAGVRDGAHAAHRAARARPGRAAARPATCSSSVHVRPHELFGRSGDDLTLTVPVTFPEAALGTTLRVPTLDGSVSLKVPRRARRPGARCGCAAAACPSASGGTGDLLVTVEVAVPQQLTRRGPRGAGEVRGRAAGRPAPADHRRARPSRRAAGASRWLMPTSAPRRARGRAGLRHLGGRAAGRHARADAAPVRPARAGHARPDRAAAGGATPPATSPCCARCSGSARTRASTSPASSASSSSSRRSTRCARGSPSCAPSSSRRYAELDAAPPPVHRPGGLAAAQSAIAAGRRARPTVVATTGHGDRMRPASVKARFARCMASPGAAPDSARSARSSVVAAASVRRRSVSSGASTAPTGTAKLSSAARFHSSTAAAPTASTAGSVAPRGGNSSVITWSTRVAGCPSPPGRRPRGLAGW